MPVPSLPVESSLSFLLWLKPLKPVFVRGIGKVVVVSHGNLSVPPFCLFSSYRSVSVHSGTTEAGCGLPCTGRGRVLTRVILAVAPIAVRLVF